MKANALIAVLATALLVASCAPKSEYGNSTTSKPEKEYIKVTKYEMGKSNSCTWVEKYEIEGHEYIVFHNKVANPPFVIHSASCPNPVHKQY